MKLKEQYSKLEGKIFSKQMIKHKLSDRIVELDEQINDIEIEKNALKVKILSEKEAIYPKIEDAYWISQVGEIIPVPLTHIKRVFEEPAKFSLTKDELISTYKQYGEKIPFEGKARNFIISNLLMDAWIRLRYNRKNDCWTVQCSELSEEIRENLIEWCRHVNLNPKYLFSDLKINSILDNKTVKISLIEFLSDVD